MKKSLEQTQKEFKQFMDDYVALMRIRHQNDMAKAKRDILFKLLPLILFATAYILWIEPLLFEMMFGVKS